MVEIRNRDLVENRNMKDYIILFGSIIFLGVYFWFDKKNFKDFFYKDPYEKFNTVRLYFILIVGIILMTLMILKKTS